MPAQPIPAEIHGQRYVSLTTFRKTGVAVPTPLWFTEESEKLYFMTRSDSGKYKRIRNNADVRVAPCTIRGRVTGPEFAGTVRIMPETEWPRARKALQEKYWLARLPCWSKKNVFLAVTLQGATAVTSPPVK
jgi:PPOX class probable F420-dependent enzyme